MTLALQAVIVLLNVAIGAAAVTLGLHDMVTAEGFWETGLAVAFAVSGGVLVVSSLVLFFSRSRAAKEGSLYGLLAGCVPGFGLAMLQFVDYDWNLRLLAWGAAAVVPLGTAIVCRSCGLSFPRSSTLTAATFLTAALSVASLALTLRPANQPEILQAEITPKVVGHRTGPGNTELAIVQTTLTTKNLSNRRLLHLGSVYNIYADHVEARPGGQDATWTTDMEKDTWAGRFEVPHRSELVESGCQLYDLGDFLEPGQQDVTTIVSVLPSRSFNTAYTEAYVITAHADRLRLGDPLEDASGAVPPGPAQTKSCLGARRTVEWAIDPATWTRSLTETRRSFHFDYQASTENGVPGLSWDAWAGSKDDLHLRSDDPYYQRLARLYGIGWVGAYKELALDDP